MSHLQDPDFGNSPRVSVTFTHRLTLYDPVLQTLFKYYQHPKFILVSSLIFSWTHSPTHLEQLPSRSFEGFWANERTVYPGPMCWCAMCSTSSSSEYHTHSSVPSHGKSDGYSIYHYMLHVYHNLQCKCALSLHIMLNMVVVKSLLLDIYSILVGWWLFRTYCIVLDVSNTIKLTWE